MSRTSGSIVRNPSDRSPRSSILPPTKSLISIVGDPIPGKRRNTEDNLDVLVQTTSKVTETQIQMALEDYMDEVKSSGTGSQSRFYTPTTSKASEWIEISQLWGFLSFTKEKNETRELNHVSRDVDVKLGGSPLTSRTRNTTNFMNYLASVSVNQDTEKVLITALRKNESTLKEVRAVEFQKKQNEIFTYTPDRENSMRLSPCGDVSDQISRDSRSKNKVRKRNRKMGFFAPCCCCCKN